MKKETGNKILLFSIIALFLISIISQTVLAEIAVTSEDVKAAGSTVGTFMRSFAESLLNPIFAGENALGMRLMLAVLLFLIIWTLMPNIIGEDYRIIGFVLSLIITSLAIMAIPPTFLNAIAIQYGLMGATILSIIPFAIILIFSIRIQNALIARVIWLFYTMYYFAFYLYAIFNQPGSGMWYWVTTETIPYVGAIIAGLIMFIFIVPIRKIIFQADLSALKESGEQVVDRGALLHKLQKKELIKSYGLRKKGI